MLSGCRAQGSEDQIKVYTRDGSSGTREAFESIAGINQLLTIAQRLRVMGIWQRKWGKLTMQLDMYH